MALLMVTKAILANIQLGDVPAIFADVSALDRWTEFHPAKSIDAGLGRFVAWYRRYFSA